MEVEETLKTSEEEQETFQQLQTELNKSKRKEKALAKRDLGPKREIDVAKVMMVYV